MMKPELNLRLKVMLDLGPPSRVESLVLEAVLGGLPVIHDQDSPTFNRLLGQYCYVPVRYQASREFADTLNIPVVSTPFRYIRAQSQVHSSRLYRFECRGHENQVSLEMIDLDY